MTSKKLNIKNPHIQKSDYVPVWIKLIWKTFIVELLGIPHHQTIIPETPIHPAWILGAIPGNFSIKKLLEKNPNRRVHIVSMLTNSESVITEKNHFIKEGKIKITRKPWHDHSTVDLKTGKNQMTKGMILFQKNLYEEFTKKPIKEAFYCHCMAGRARSLIETMSFIYFHPKKEVLFDFESWPSEITKKIPGDLKRRLKDNPSFSDIEEFIRIRRPNVKTLLEMDGDQAGILGLMTLETFAKNPEIIKIRDEKRLYKDAQNIGLILETPLDLAFRDQEDLKEQEENFFKAYKIFLERGVNLPAAMMISIYENIDPLWYKNNIEINFKKLMPCEQARFILLLKKLEDKNLNLSPFKSATHYVQILVKNIDKLTSGDQIELLKTFGADVTKLTPKKIIEKISKGSKLDKFNAKIQIDDLKSFTT